MSAVDQLITYILSLTPEQAEKVVSQLPRLTKLLRDPQWPKTYAEYLQTAITETILDVSDEKLLDYTHTMLMSAVTEKMQPADQ